MDEERWKVPDFFCRRLVIDQTPVFFVHLHFGDTIDRRKRIGAAGYTRHRFLLLQVAYQPKEVSLVLQGAPTNALLSYFAPFS